MLNKICAVSLGMLLAVSVWTGAKDAPSTAPVVFKKYGIKSAVVTMTMEMSMDAALPEGAPAMGGSSGTITLTFDNSGEKEDLVTETAMEMMGMKMNTKMRILKKDGYVYTIDMDKKRGIKSKLVKIDDPAKLDFNNTNADYIKKWNIKKEGTAVVAGKTCDVYSFKTDDLQAASGMTKVKDKIPMEGTVSVWKNLGLKTDFLMNGSMKIKTEATKVDESSAIPQSAFDIPPDVSIKSE